MTKSTESLSFLGVFLVHKSCHPRNSTLRPFFRKTNTAIAFGRSKNLGLEIFVANGATTSRHAPRRNLRRTTVCSPENQRLKTTSQLPRQQHVSPSNHSLLATCQQCPITLPCPVSCHRSATCHPVPRHQSFKNCKFAPHLQKITESPLYFLKLQNHPYTFQNCTFAPKISQNCNIGPKIFIITILPLFQKIVPTS